MSLSPTHTEMLFAIGAGDQVVAVDDQSDFPEAALDVQTKLSGFEPNVEAIAGYEPDLVVISNDGGLVAQLDDLGIETYLGPAAATLDDAYTQIEQLGALTGHVGEAAELVGPDGDRHRRADRRRAASSPSRCRCTTSSIRPSSAWTSSTFIGQIYSMFGLRNIADETEDSAGGVSPAQPGVHRVQRSRHDLPRRLGVLPAGRRPPWQPATDGSDLSAVTNGLVFSMSDDIASRWGPRTVDYVRDVRAAVEQAAALQPAG